MEEIKVGDVVDITIKRATVCYVVNANTVDVVFSGTRGNRSARIPHDSAAVTVERVTPTIQRGDVFKDNDGDLWCAISDGQVVLVDEGEPGNLWEFDKANARFGLTLVSRVQEAV